MNEITTADAIAWFEKRKAGITMSGANAMYDKAIAALRAQMEAEKDDPLRLEELREMVQKCEGIYVAHVDGSPVFRDQTHGAAVLDISPAFGSAVRHVYAIYGNRLTFWEDEYGKTWLAYRRRPPEDTQWK